MEANETVGDTVMGAVTGNLIMPSNSMNRVIYGTCDTWRHYLAGRVIETC